MVLHTCLLPGIGADFFGFAEVQGDCVEITEWLGHGLIFFFTKIPLIGDAMAAFLAVVLVGTAFAISTRYKRDFHEPLAKAIERSEEHTFEIQSLMRISYAVFSLKKKTNRKSDTH